MAPNFSSTPRSSSTLISEFQISNPIIGEANDVPLLALRYENSSAAHFDGTSKSSEATPLVFASIRAFSTFSVPEKVSTL